VSGPHAWSGAWAGTTQIVDTTEELLRLERDGWKALSTSGEAAGRFYAENLAANVLMLLPGGIVIDDREAVIESMSGSPWKAFELSDHRVLELSDRSAVVAYRATAQRAGREAYTALFNSIYVREGSAWRLAVHQQTPI
jgi:hypothetical protein